MDAARPEAEPVKTLHELLAEGVYICSIEEMARAFRISRRSMERYIKNGDISIQPVGRRRRNRRFPIRDVLALLGAPEGAAAA